MPHLNSHKKGLLAGALLGIALAASAVSLLRTSQGKKLRANVAQKSQEYFEDIEDFLYNLRDNVELSWNEKTETMADRAGKGVQYLKDEISTLTDEEHKDIRKGLLLGGILGCLAGIGGSFLLYENVCKRSQEGYTEKMRSYTKPARRVLEEISYLFNESSPRARIRETNRGETFNDILDVAHAGINLWKKMRK